MSVSPFKLIRVAAATSLALAVMGASASSGADTVRVIVQFKPGTEAAALARSAIANAGGQVKLEILQGTAVAVELPKRMVSRLKNHAGVALVEEDAKRHLMALAEPTGRPYQTGQLKPYGISMVQADQLPRGDRDAANRKLCIIDSGYDNTHEDLAGNDVDGEFDSGTGWWYTDESSHGTHVAGTIAALNNKGTGVVGVNPSGTLKLHIVKTFGADGTWAYSSNLIAATEKCAAAGANVISMSLGGPLPNSAERTQFQKLADAGILSIAAAGNGGNRLTSYPAGYPAVMSVAAIDEFKAVAAFSQFNKDVEIAAPGVAVLSTVPMGRGTGAKLKVDGTAYAPLAMSGSPQVKGEGKLVDFGLGTTVDTRVTGRLCLIQRGEITFAEKVLNCQNSGGVGAVIYNNVPGSFAGTMGDVTTAIPSAGVSDTEGAAMLEQVGKVAKLNVGAASYAYFDGTSMATPHVSAVAALVWSYFPSCTGEQIRRALTSSAEDLGAAGRDTRFGYGLVQAKAAYDLLAASGGCTAN